MVDFRNFWDFDSLGYPRTRPSKAGGPRGFETHPPNPEESPKRVQKLAGIGRKGGGGFKGLRFKKARLPFSFPGRTPLHLEIALKQMSLQG